MDNWTIAFLITTSILTIITFRKILRRERPVQRLALAHRLKRKGHPFYHPEVIASAYRRRFGKSALDWWARDAFSD